MSESTLQSQTNPKLTTAVFHVGDREMMIDEAGNVDGDLYEIPANKDGYAAFWKIDAGVKYLLVRAPGYQDWQQPVSMPHDELITVDLQRTALPVPRLTMGGTRFYANGQPVFLAGASAFLLYRDYLDGKDVRPFLAMLQNLGCNMVRVFGMCHYIPVNQGQPEFAPQAYGDRYYDSIPAFYGLLAEYGMYGLWTNFPDNGLIMPNIGDQLPHHARVVGKLGEVSGSIYELTNEPGAHGFNYVDANQFFQPMNIPSCVGGYGDEYGAELPPGPWWLFGGYHPPRRYPGHILDCNCVNHPFTLKLGKGVLLTEPDRFGSRGNENVDQARQSAGASRQAALGIVFHSASGRDSTNLFDDPTMNSARAFFGALGV